MALIKIVTNAQGVTANYHRINASNLRFNLDHSTVATAVLASYVDAATRAADRQPVSQSSFRFEAPAGVAVDQAYLYDQIKTQPAWSDAASDVAPVASSASPPASQ